MKALGIDHKEILSFDYLVALFASCYGGNEVLLLSSLVGIPSGRVMI